MGSYSVDTYGANIAGMDLGHAVSVTVVGSGLKASSKQESRRLRLSFRNAASFFCLINVKTEVGAKTSHRAMTRIMHFMECKVTVTRAAE